MNRHTSTPKDDQKIIDLQKRVEAKVGEEREIYGTEAGITCDISSQDIIDALKANEDGDAWLFREINRNRLCYDHSRRLWHIWNKHYWKEDDVGNALAEIESVVDIYADEASRQARLKIDATKNGDNETAGKSEKIEKELLSRIHTLQTLRRKKNILTLASAGTESLGIPGDQWDSDPYLIGCQNSVIDLRTGNARPGHPSDNIKTIAPTEWQGLDAPAPTFKQFIHDIFDGETDLIAFIQRLFGFACSGLSIEHVFPILWGDGRNGKGTLIETIREVIGGLSGPIQSEMLLKQTFTRSSAGPSPDIMGLYGKRIVWADEIDEGRMLNVAKVKWLAGGDTLVGRPVQGKKEIRFKPTHTLFLLTNHKPKIPADDHAIWQRVLLIPFNISFVDNPQKSNHRKRDPYIGHKLLSEAPGILAWLVKGFVEYHNLGLNPPELVKANTEKYREDEDVLGQFITECCSISKGSKQQAGPFYTAYKTWCEQNSYKPLGKRKFGERMVDRFDRVDEGYRFYMGVELNAP